MKLSNLRIAGLLGVSMSLVVASSTFAGAKDDAALAKAPAAVQAAAKKALGDKKLDEFDVVSVGGIRSGIQSRQHGSRVCLQRVGRIDPGGGRR